MCQVFLYLSYFTKESIVNGQSDLKKLSQKFLRNLKIFHLFMGAGQKSTASLWRGRSLQHGVSLWHGGALQHRGSLKNGVILARYVTLAQWITMARCVTFAQWVTFARYVTIVRRHFNTMGHFSTVGNFCTVSFIHTQDILSSFILRFTAFHIYELNKRLIMKMFQK